MSRLRAKAAGILLIILALSMDFTPHLLVARVLAKQENYGDFLNRLEGYLRDALPPESSPIKECEYVAPDGFSPALAERLWIDLAPFVSLGYSEQAIRENLASIHPNATIPVEVDGGMVVLNLTGLRVEKPSDGSVRARIPVSSEKPLNYTHYNSTNVQILYEAWNETLVKYYDVKSLLPLLNVSYRNLETNETLTRLIKPFLNTTVMLENNTVTQGLSLNVTVPEHQEEIVTIVPEQARELKVIFPKYTVNIKIYVFTPLPNESKYILYQVRGGGNHIGEIYVVTWHAVPCPGVDPEKEPLNAIIRINVLDGLEVMGEDSLHITSSQPFGAFYVRILKAGWRMLKLTIEGNADFGHGKRERTDYMYVFEHGPSIIVSVLSVDASPGHAKVKVRIENIGDETAKSLRYRVYWCEWEDTPLNFRQRFDPLEPYIRDYLAPGDSCEFTYEYELGAPHAYIWAGVIYYDPAGMDFGVGLEVPVNYTPAGPPAPAEEEYITEVPEHWEKYLVVMPPHAETMRITVLGYSRRVSISMQGLDLSLFENMLRGLMDGENGVAVPLVLGETLTYGMLAPLTLSTPLLGVELSIGKAMEEGETRYVMENVERLFNDLGIFNETTVCRMLNLTREDLRNGRIPKELNVTPAYEKWVNSSTMLLNATQFAAYNHTLSKYIAENSLQGEFKIGWNKLTNATRLTKPVNETGFLTLVYHPLSIKGSGPLKSIQVRNYHGNNLSYRLKVSGYQVSGYMVTVGQPPRPPLWENFSSPFKVASLGDSVLLASSIAPEGCSYRIQLLWGSSIVAEAFFDLHPEPSPFWTGFWEGVKGSLGGILVTSTIIIVTSALTGGGTAAGYVGLAISIATTLYHLIAGSIVNIAEIRQGMDAATFLGGLADFYGNLSYRLSNYTPPKAPPPYGAPPIEAYKPFEPKGPLAEAFWEESKAYRAASAKVVFDTGLNIVFQVGVSDFETAFNPDAKEYDRGLACGRIVGAALLMISFVAATRIAAELRPKMESFKTSMWSAVGSLKAWLTFALYDLVEAIVKGRRVVKWVVENPGEALAFAKLTILGALEKLRGRSLEIWENVKARIRSAVDEAESQTRDEDCHRSMSNAIESLSAEAELNGKLTEVAEHTDQWKTYELFCRLDDARLSVEERARVLEALDTIAGKSREAGDGVIEWLRMLEAGRLREILASGLLSQVKDLEVNGLKSLQVALEDPARLTELAAQPELVSEAMETLRGAKYYEYEDRRMTSGGSIWLTGTVDEGFYKVRAEVEGELGVKIWTIKVRKEEGTNQITVPTELRGELAGKTIKKLEFCGYVPELHFPKHFTLKSLEGDVFLDFVEDGLKISGFKVRWSRIGETVRDAELGLGLTIETEVKSVERGKPLILRFYEKGGIRCVVGESSEVGTNVREIEGVSLEVRQLGSEQIASLKLNIETEKGAWESIYPIKTLELKIGEKYPMDFSVKDQDRTTGLQSEVRKIFGYDAVDEVQKKMEAGAIRARIFFDDGLSAGTSGKELVVRTGGAERVVEIMFYEPILKPLFTIEKAVEHFRKLGIQNEELVDHLADRYYEVLGYKAEEVEERGDDNLKGLFGELQIIERYPEKLKYIQYMVKVDGRIKRLDVVFVDAPVESKYWTSKKSYIEHFNELVEELKGYRKAVDQEGFKQAYLVFGKKGVMSDAEFGDYTQRLRDALGGDTSWLIICHGFDEFNKAYVGR
ncbi:MAG: hypothetical protein ACP5PL_05170 [Infirmifilum sp.]